MLIVHSPGDLPKSPRGLSVAWGMFDGVHLGHQHVIRAALADGFTHGSPTAVLTFDPHPLRVVHPDRAPRLLQSLPQRLRALQQLGVDAALVFPFTAEVAAWSGEAFLRRFAADAGGIRSLSVGDGFQFGHQRSGDVPLLQRLGRELGFVVHAAPPVALGGEVVSSSRIRQCLREGRIEHAGELLGRPYALAGIVVRGDRLGRELGAPTANLAVEGLELPPPGVYAARVRWLRRQSDHLAVLNLGVRPTLAEPEGEWRFEVHLLDFRENLYEDELEVTFVQYLRPEQRFESLPALQRQIAQDIAAARKIFA